MYFFGKSSPPTHNLLYCTRAKHGRYGTDKRYKVINLRADHATSSEDAEEGERGAPEHVEDHRGEAARAHALCGLLEEGSDERGARVHLDDPAAAALLLRPELVVHGDVACARLAWQRRG